MQLRPLYTVRFRYPDSWEVDLSVREAPNNILIFSLRAGAKALSRAAFAPATILDGERTRHL